MVRSLTSVRRRIRPPNRPRRIALRRNISRQRYPVRNQQDSGLTHRYRFSQRCLKRGPRTRSDASRRAVSGLWSVDGPLSPTQTLAMTTFAAPLVHDELDSVVSTLCTRFPTARESRSRSRGRGVRRAGRKSDCHRPFDSPDSQSKSTAIEHWAKGSLGFAFVEPPLINAGTARGLSATIERRAK